MCRTSGQHALRIACMIGHTRDEVAKALVSLVLQSLELRCDLVVRSDGDAQCLVLVALELQGKRSECTR